MTDLSQYTLSNETGICLLDCETAFNNLTDTEKLYSHYLSQASFHGGLIVLLQTSPESPGIFVLLQKLFRAQSVETLEKLALQKGLSAEQVKALFMYAAGFYANMGNYKSFGDSKFIPNLPKDKFEAVVLGSTAASEDPKGIQSLWEAVKEPMYSLDDRVKNLGLPPKGLTTYFSSNCDLKDAELAQEFLDKMDLSAYNTRLFKIESGGHKPVYEVRLASTETKDGLIPGLSEGMIGEHIFKPKNSEESFTFKVTRGDYSQLLSLVVDDLSKAKSHAVNENENKMLQEYITSFTTGSNPAHKDGSRYWIKNKGPIVETYIGFIESYRDPFGVRGEFEGIDESGIVRGSGAIDESGIR
ncbi:dipeptidyl peptidase 3-like [Gigantopelta aegis]|uniref:dipeptidyl peptidase 3-like n=1 Tax=Gigantopelta aegis TaxID=1735272 RepID=UPI001B88C72D|nr:dipeptidyl peptidase 3-like [Gigantopelta aegis]